MKQLIIVFWRAPFRVKMFSIVFVPLLGIQHLLRNRKIGDKLLKWCNSLDNLAWKRK